MHELELRAREARVEPLSDALLDELEALSVAVTDADAGTEAEQPIFGEPGLGPPGEGWRHSSLVALFETLAAAQAAQAWLASQPWAAEVAVVGLRELADQDWVQLTQSQFEPVPITPEFWIVPSWHQPPPEARRVIRLDPGQAFGTGTHPTTRMCLRWIARHARPWARVLDYGCGSGILAIGAALHGARSIDAVDIDPAAIAATQANAAANGIELSAGPPTLAHGAYELVLANILATPLKLLAPLLTSHLDFGADLVLAGILERQAEEIAEAYAPALRLVVTDLEEGWIVMSATRLAPAGVA